MDHAKFYSSFETMVDKTPAIAFCDEFQKKFFKEATRKFGDIFPRDRARLFEVAEVVLIQMGKPTET